MPHQTGIHKLSRVGGQRRAMFRGLVRSLILHQRIRTTEARAKAVRPLVERLLTWGRRSLIASEQGNDLRNQSRAVHCRRMAFSYLPDNQILKTVFDELAPKYRDRNGGYTRILKIGQRKGDGAHMVFLEFV
jgi:large subunit ribosomal protein L17